MQLEKKFGVRSVALWPPEASSTGKNVFEERILIITADTLDDALEQAQAENIDYCRENNFTPLSLYQAYEIDDIPHAHSEVFSQLRNSDLPPEKYLYDTFISGVETDEE